MPEENNAPPMHKMGAQSSYQIGDVKLNLDFKALDYDHGATITVDSNGDGAPEYTVHAGDSTGTWQKGDQPPVALSPQAARDAFDAVRALAGHKLNDPQAEALTLFARSPETHSLKEVLGR